MKKTQETMAIKNLKTFLGKVIHKYYTDCESAAVELVSWIDTECIKTGYGRIGFYACVAIAEVCWKVWDHYTYEYQVDVDYEILISNILAIIRRNDTDFSQMSDAELFEIQFSNFAE